ncbi:MAG: Gfo/Idh/MocA family oxidoreductase [Candidatus Latescibacterota bacterium]
MESRRSFIEKAALIGVAEIVASHCAPAFAQDMKIKKIGVLGLGSHNFAAIFKTRPEGYTKEILCKPYGVWDDIPRVAEAMKGNVFEKVYTDPVQLAKECDCVHIEHADYRKVLELAQPGLEMGKPTFINRPFAATISDAEEIVRLAGANNAPLMSASSLEFGNEVPQMQEFSREKGPVRAYEAYGPEGHFTWHLPHVINYAHAGLGGGIDTVYFAGDYEIDLRTFRNENKPTGDTICVLTYKSRESQPPIIGMCHVNNYPGQFHVNVYAVKENRNFTLQGNWSLNMFDKLNDLYSFGKIPRPYEAILEQHRTLVAANVSRLTGREVKLDSLGGEDSLPYSDGIRDYVVKRTLAVKKS